MNMHSAAHVPADEVTNTDTVVDDNIQGSWFDRFPISTKLHAVVLASTLVLALLAAGILGTMAYHGDRGESLRVLSFTDSRSGAAFTMVWNADSELNAYVSSGDPDRLADTVSDLEKADIAFDEVMADDLDRLDPVFAEQISSFHRETKALLTRVSAPGLSREAAAPIAGDLRKIALEGTQFSNDISYFAETQGEPAFAAIRNSLIILSILVVILTILSVIGSRSVVRNISGMIVSMTSAMEKIADGYAETSIPGRERKDEIGAMARALTVFRSSALELRDMTARRMEEAEEQLAQQQLLSQGMADLQRQKSKLLEDMAAGFEFSVGEVITAVSAASEQLKETSKQMVRLAEGSNEQAKGATAAMEKATANVTAAAAATDEFALSISEISRQASASASLARDASKLVTSANTRMTDLSQAAVEIGEIAGLIQTIAQRTNLLALNASIEAARGGEAGRGFAVVASEVKELAMQTSNATSSVAERIAAMQDSTKSSASDLTSIVKQISELEQAAVMIASAVDQQSVSGEELARNIDTVANGSAQVGERLKALREASKDTGSAAEEVVDSARALGGHAENLRAKASSFIEDVRRSARELEHSDADFRKSANS